MENLKKLAKEKNLQSRIIFEGQLSIDQIKKELLDSKIFLFMSKTEAFGMVLLEAMFCGNSLISYDCKHGPSDIVNNKNGFLIPMNNKILFQERLSDLIIDRSELERLNRGAFEESKFWRKEKILEKWMKIITI